jgi:hypothetical protein
MENENVNQELRYYVDTAVKRGISQESIVNTLLSKGWLRSEIKNELIMNGNTIDGDVAVTGAEKRKEWFAVASVVLFVLAVVLYFIGQAIFSALLFFSGLVLGVIGVKSKRNVYATFGIVLNFLALAIIAFLVGSVIYMIKTDKFPLTGEKLTEQQKIDFGINDISDSK